MVATEAQAAAPDARAANRPALSASLKGFFRMLSHGVPGRAGSIELRQHGGAGYSSGMIVSTDERPLPEGVLRIMERSASPWGACLAVRQAGGGKLLSLSALAAHREFPRVYQNPSDPASPNGKRWEFPFGDIAKWEASLEEWPVRPTMFARALPAVWALWALVEPLPLGSAEDQAAAVELLRTLARAATAEAPGPPADVEVPLVGTRCANQEPRVVTCSLLAEGRIYAASAIDAATRRK